MNKSPGNMFAKSMRNGDSTERNCNDMASYSPDNRFNLNTRSYNDEKIAREIKTLIGKACFSQKVTYKTRYTLENCAEWSDLSHVQLPTDPYDQDHNYCRNVDSSSNGPFCYTNSLDKQSCDVCMCEQMKCTVSNPDCNRQRRDKPVEEVCSKNLRNKVDMLVMIDGSQSVNNFNKVDNFIRGKEFLSSMVNSLPIGDDKILVGILQFTDEYGKPRVEAQLTGDKNGLTQRFNEYKFLEYMDASTYTGNCLEKAYQMFGFTSQSNCKSSIVYDPSYTFAKSQRELYNCEEPRSDADKVLVVLTDGRATDQEKVKQYTRLLKNQGVQIFVIGVGSHIDHTENRQMASSNGHFIKGIENYSELMQNGKWVEIVGGICKRVPAYAKKFNLAKSLREK